jgi:hypothetical protein
VVGVVEGEISWVAGGWHPHIDIHVSSAAASPVPLHDLLWIEIDLSAFDNFYATLNKTCLETWIERKKINAKEVIIK